MATMKETCKAFARENKVKVTYVEGEIVMENNGKQIKREVYEDTPSFIVWTVLINMLSEIL